MQEEDKRKSLWQRLLGDQACRCCKADIDAVYIPEDVPAQIAHCDGDLLRRGDSLRSNGQVPKVEKEKELVRGDKRRWTDTSIASNTDKGMGLSLNEFAVVHRAARSLQKAVGISNQPTARELDRGVHVEILRLL